MVPKASTPKLDFRIKLLAGNNVVMIESNGYETEIFMPQIINGRIGFQNIIPNRRCCLYGATLNPPTKAGKNSRLHGIDSTTQTDRKPLLPTTNSRAWRMNAGTEKRFVSPLAYSTPAVLFGKENYRSDCRSNISNTSTLPTPELARRIPTPLEVANDPLFQIPSGSKVIPMYRNPTPNTPKRVGRVVSNINSYVKSVPKSTLISNTSKITPYFTPLEGVRRGDCSPVRPISELRSGRNSTILNATQSTARKPATPGSITKWRKCITPVRTYSRRQIQKRSSMGSVKKIHNTSSARIRTKFSNTGCHGKVLPTYRVNPTQSVRSNLKVEVKKRKIVIDPKTSITPRTFKRQQNETEDLKHNSSYRLPKNRKQYEAVKPSAFDLLTSSNRSRCMSSKLNSQFRKGCVNKVSTTYPKYKVLCALPPLEKKDGDREQTTQGEANSVKTQSDKQHASTAKLTIVEPFEKAK